MPDVASPYVLHGAKSYVDYDRARGNRRQWLVSVQEADILTNALAVFLTLTMKSVFNILKRIWIFYWYGANSDQKASGGDLAKPAAMNGTGNAAPGPSSSQSSTALPASAGNIVTGAGVGTSDGVPPADGDSSEDAEQADAAEQNAPEPPTHSVNSTQQFEVDQNAYQDADSPESWMGLAVRLYRQSLQSLRTGRINVGPQHYGFHELWVDIKKFPADVNNNLTSDIAKDFGKGTLIMLIMGVLYFGGILLGVFSSAIIISDSVALSRHPRCGIFLDVADTTNSSSQVGDPLYDGRRKYYYDVKSDCGQYARQCYHAGDDADGCNFFYTRSFNYSIKHNDTCPFRGNLGYLCHDGPSSAFTLSTDSIKAKDLGINSRYAYTFSRSTTCSPLLMDKRFVRPFVQKHGPGGRSHPGFRYFYGNRTGDMSCTSQNPDCTFEMRTPSIEQKAFENTGYTLRQETYDPTRTKNWTPIFAVDATAGESATLLFINNMGVFYPHTRDDPVFRADTRLGNQSQYYNSRLHAGVLACMDRTMFCPPHNATCVPSLASLDPTDLAIDELAVQYMLALGLVFSNTGDSVRYRRAEALDAQAKVSSPDSIELAQEQWKVEAQQLFETSLARIQISLRNIVRSNLINGTVTDNIQTLPAEVRQLCDMYKFRSVGWRNVSVSHLLGIIFSALVVFSAGITTDDKKLWVEKRYSQFAKSRLGEVLGSLCVQVRDWILEAPEAVSGVVVRSLTAIGGRMRKMWTGNLVEARRRRRPFTPMPL